MLGAASHAWVILAKLHAVTACVSDSCIARHRCSDSLQKPPSSRNYPRMLPPGLPHTPSQQEQEDVLVCVCVCWGEVCYESQTNPVWMKATLLSLVKFRPFDQRSCSESCQILLHYWGYKAKLEKISGVLMVVLSLSIWDLCHFWQINWAVALFFTRIKNCVF